MPRNLRVHYPGALYHVWSRGVEKRAIFLSDRDRRAFLVFLRQAAKEDGAGILSYCLMGNHFHLLLAIDETPLATTMQKLLTRYSLYFNRVQRRVGHLFQGRYGASACKDLAYLIQVVTYIHKNPVRAGFAKSPADWPWSSHAELVRLSGPLLDLGRLAQLCGMAAEELRDRYMERLAETAGEAPRTRRSLAAMIADAAAIVGVESAAIARGKRGGPYSRAKRLVADWGADEGYTEDEIARALNCSQAAVSLMRKRKSYIGV